MVDFFDGVHPFMALVYVAVFMCICAGIIQILCVLPFLSLRRRRSPEASAVRVHPANSSPNVSGASGYHANGVASGGAAEKTAPPPPTYLLYLHDEDASRGAAEKTAPLPPNLDEIEAVSPKVQASPVVNGAAQNAAASHIHDDSCLRSAAAGEEPARHSDKAPHVKFSVPNDCEDPSCARGALAAIPDAASGVYDDVTYWNRTENMSMMMALADAAGIWGPTPPPSRPSSAARFHPQPPQDAFPQLPVLSINDAIADAKRLEAMEKQAAGNGTQSPSTLTSPETCERWSSQTYNTDVAPCVEKQAAGNENQSPSSLTGAETCDGSFESKVLEPRPKENLTVNFTPGRIGVKPDWSTGLIKEIQAGGQAHKRGVTVGMRFLKVDAVDYAADLLRRKIAGDLNYEVVFAECEYASEELRPRTPPVELT